MQPILLIIKHLHTIFQLGNVSNNGMRSYAYLVRTDAEGNEL